MKKRTTNAIEIVEGMFGDDPEWDEMVAEEELKLRIGQLVYELRAGAQLTQKQLADRLGTSQSVISKVENADYDGSALEMLWRVCIALRRRIEIRCPSGKSRHTRRAARASA